MHYRTEIEITADRYVCLQLPDFIPPGRAIVTVRVTATEDLDDAEARVEREPDDPRHDIEWWDEFAADDPRLD